MEMRLASSQEIMSGTHPWRHAVWHQTFLVPNTDPGTKGVMLLSGRSLSRLSRGSQISRPKLAWQRWAHLPTVAFLSHALKLEFQRSQPPWGNTLNRILF